MMIKLKLDTFDISVNGGIWSCQQSSGIQRSLRKLLTTSEIDSYYPDMDYALAELAVKRLGAQIISATDPPEYVEGRIY